MKQTIQELLREKVSEAAGMPVEILIPPDPKLGDYSTNAAFIIAKKGAKKNPNDAAGGLKSQIEADLSSEFDIKVENGFLNFYTKLDFLQTQLLEINHDQNYGKSIDGVGKKVIVEYSSPNIAKPMHIGHLRSTIIGDSLANVYEKLGYEVIRWNYIGDWGTQFGKLIAAYKKWGDEKALKKNPIQEMLRVYVKFHEEAKNNPELVKEGQEEFRQLEEGTDDENLKLWERFRQMSLLEFQRIYEELNVGLSGDSAVIKGESSYREELKPLIQDLKDRGLAKESQGALIIDLDKYNLPPALLEKSDGATLYLTRDLASLKDRILNYGPSEILYVFANQQALHFQQMAAIAKELDLTGAKLIHVKFGVVLGEDGKKLATREGKVVLLQEVIDKITALSIETVKHKNPNLSDAEVEGVARMIGLGALKYNDLKQHPYSDIEFDWKAMLDLSGNSGPYIQYTYARLANIISKVSNFGEGDASLLIEPSERALMRQLLDYPDIIRQCAQYYALNSLALFLYELSHRANQFYEQVHVLEDENTARRDARLLLIKTVVRTLKDGLAILGIKTPERI